MVVFIGKSARVGFWPFFSDVQVVPCINGQKVEKVGWRGGHENRKFWAQIRVFGGFSSRPLHSNIKIREFPAIRDRVTPSLIFYFSRHPWFFRWKNHMFPDAGLTVTPSLRGIIQISAFHAIAECNIRIDQKVGQDAVPKFSAFYLGWEPDQLTLSANGKWYACRWRQRGKFDDYWRFDRAQAWAKSWCWTNHCRNPTNR